MTASPGKNPYRPGAATSPLFLAGRDGEIRRFARTLRAAPELPANLCLTGLRGVGKTVLLKELERVGGEAGWSTARTQLEPRHNTDQSLTQHLASVCTAARARMSRTRRVRSALGDAIAAGRRLVRVEIEDLSFSLAGAPADMQDLAATLLSTTNEATETGHEGFLLLLDEAQVVRDERGRNGEHPLSRLVASVNALQEQGVPLALVLCGLPTLRANLQHARTYSERMFRAEDIGALAGNPGPARDAFTRPLDGTDITADEDLIDRVLTEVAGYPYFIQLWGAELWDAACDAGLTTFSVALLDELESEIYRRLDREFYLGRVQALTPSEQDLLWATAGCPYPPLHTADIQRLSPKSPSNINVLMGRLADQGVVYRVSKGTYEYTAPRFHEYLQRHHPGPAS